ncbi:integral membrane ion exchanger [Actinomadura sp. NBRC 104425]|uniref:cation:proton antiporter n=1 Tax=Actinomadura sp. NBRC 104425 TaxID=3032204 RepID=UPI0024A4D41F|nr:cation:proton antiporter [Actinomadura sp. NBRC 104425]GLZ14925.1 integral membrane ion exchanger [Actinomadura sp. NBRC 104425]
MAMDGEAITAMVIGGVGVIVVASWLLGSVARRLGQPTVIGHIVAGIALGPTLLGQLPGNPTEHLFPAEARPFLTVLSQVAVVIFMFVAGYEIDPRSLRGGGRGAVMVAVLALAVPMGLTAGVIALFHDAFAGLRGEHADGRSFLLFMMVATSITALPVLAAIVRERGLAGTPAGTVATTAAGFMDVAAWVVLAAALAGTGHQTRWPWPVILLLAAGFVAVMFLVVRPVLGWWLARPAALLAEQLPIALGLALGSAWVTASLGLHPVFGGFLAGLAMPRPNGTPEPEVLRPMEQSANLLLPLFFVTTGLSFDLGSLEWRGLPPLGLILVIAIAGKLLPAYGAARLAGLGPHSSALVAALVNTRGLTELIALNVGLAAGLVGGELFTVLMLMALITTLMTGPLLAVLTRRERSAPAPATAPADAEGTPR